MLVDLIIVGVLVVAAVLGFRQGLRTGALVLIGFGAGAVLGSRVAPLVLSGGLRDPFAPVLALPAALLFGAVLAAALERFGFQLKRRLRNLGWLDAIGGALLAACVGAVMVWVLGAVAARVDSLKESVAKSSIIERLNAVVPPPGPLLIADRPYDPFPVIAGPRSGVGPATAKIKTDPQVKAAARSVLKVNVTSCERGRGSGSGWIAKDGVVVTNAHVVEDTRTVTVKLGGKGRSYNARPIWFDDAEDVAILRVPGVSGTPALPIDEHPKRGTTAALLGFPRGGPYRVRPAKLGRRVRLPTIRVEGRVFRRRSVTTMRAFARPGNSGGPVVDGRGRVVAMVFGVRPGGLDAYAVPSPVVQKALERAGAPADTGSC